MRTKAVLELITSPERIWSRAEVIGTRPSPVPAEPGVYGWYFRELPHAAIDASGCCGFEGLRLLYVGIAPRAPAANGGISRQHLQNRLRTHFKGSSRRSTLRMSLGCLLAERLALRLEPMGGNRFRFRRDDEGTLSAWMAENAFVAWAPTPAPWEVEDLAIRELDLPLNLRDNARHPFHRVLSDVRRAARERARGTR